MLNDFLDNLFDNIGEKIKSFVKFIFIIEAGLIVVGGVIGMLTCLINKYYIQLLLIPFVAAAAVAVCWVSCWMTYAFGELVHRVCNIDDRLTLTGRTGFFGNKLNEQQADVENNEKGTPTAEELIRKERARRAIREAEGRSAAENAAIIQKAKEENVRVAAAERANEEAPPIQRCEETQETKPKNQQLAEKLAYALAYKTDDGMIRYLKTLDEELVKEILKEPRHMIRTLIGKALEEL